MATDPIPVTGPPTPIEHMSAEDRRKLLDILANRYDAAWEEQAARITNRQNVIQFYVTSAVVLFGFYVSISSGALGGPEASGMLSSDDALGWLPDVLAFGITVLTVISLALVVVHDRVIVELCALMGECEQQMKIAASQGEMRKTLEAVDYFHGGALPPSFHAENRRVQTSAFVALMVIVELVAWSIYLVTLSSQVRNMYFVLRLVFLLLFGGLAIAAFRKAWQVYPRLSNRWYQRG